ncbi:hypothetical protein SteCoe_31528 [Stentor coeruleus]|uniref:Kinetochore protein NDC80 n=1 Tax=Stentor coeruleus TaxID=5963 RepID=A0A1R2B114_9CILI|nr:hypothetical protein SteCoe_31528 [Stentor coeruleus]
MEKKRGKIDTGLGVKAKDQRPIKDKQFQNKCAKNIIKYLILNNYTHPISLSICLAGDTSLFRDVTDFLLKKLDPFLGFNSEKELQDLLKSLGYPYPLHSQYFSGATNYWPYLLATMDWLVKLLKGFEKSKDFDICDEYFFTAYDAFMTSKPVEPIREKFNKELDVWIDKNKKNCEEVRKQIKSLKEIKRELKKDKISIVNADLIKVEQELKTQLGQFYEIEERCKIFEAKYSDFQNLIEKYLPQGIPTAEAIQVMWEDYLIAESDTPSVIKKTEEIIEKNRKMQQFVDGDEEATADYKRDLIEMQEEIEDIFRENEHLQEEIKNVEETLHSFRLKIELIKFFEKEAEKSEEKIEENNKVE